MLFALATAMALPTQVFATDQAVLASDKRGGLEVPLLLGIAYAASIGGMGTPIGTPEAERTTK